MWASNDNFHWPKRFAELKGSAPSGGRRSRSPDDPTPPAAVVAGAEPVPEPVQLNSATLAEIKRLIDQGNARVITTLEAKLNTMERRLAVVEGENMEKECNIQQLSKQLQDQVRINEAMDERLEELDMNGRLSSLILTSPAFTSHPRNSDIEQLTATVINERIPGLNMTKSDLQAAHKLQNDNKVICKFVKRQLRDRVYDARFELARFHSGNPGGGGRRLEPLYISESLTPRNRQLYDELLRAKRPENGGIIASVFSRRGIVWCRTEKGGANRRVPDEENLRRILGGRRFPPIARPPRQQTSGAAARRLPDAAAGAAPEAPRRPAECAVSGPSEDVEDGGPGGGAASSAAASSAAAPVASVPPADGVPERRPESGARSARAVGPRESFNMLTRWEKPT